MNLLLIAPEELSGDEVVLWGRRAEHCLNVLRVRPGTLLRAAVIGRGAISARVKAVNPDSLTLSCGAVTESSRPSLDVALAIPRPKALSRIIQTVSSFGARSITLFNAWRVDKSYLASPRLTPERLREDALVGCEQGRQCHVPRFRVLSRFTQLLELHAEMPGNSEERYVLHPGSAGLLHQSLHSPRACGPFSLAFGPDGGFIPRELESLIEAGWTQVALDVGPLRTEVAVAAALGVISTAPNYRATHLPAQSMPR